MLIRISSLIIIGIIATGIIVPVKLNPSERIKKYLTGVLIIVLIIVIGINVVYKLWGQPFNIKYDLPLHLCDLSLIWVLLTILTKNQYFYELAYFWGMGGAIHALITPDITVSEVNFPLLIFLINHGLVIVIAIYCTLALKMKPKQWSWLRVVIITQIYLILTGLVNIIIHSNYSYLGQKPQQTSILDYFGPWPYYLIVLEIFGVLTIVILNLPFWIINNIEKRKISNDH